MCFVALQCFRIFYDPCTGIESVTHKTSKRPNCSVHRLFITVWSMKEEESIKRMPLSVKTHLLAAF